LRRETHGNEPKVVQAVLTPDREDKRQNGRRMKEPREPMFTLTAQDRHGVLLSVTQHEVRKKEVANCLDANYYKGIYSNQERAGVLQDYRIRRLTPRECWRLQGFPDWAFDRAAAVNSDSQLYKQAGNSVTVNVIYEIAKRLEVRA
jgi:DNA (cytosine-5)-methyltransferase 1